MKSRSKKIDIKTLILGIYIKTRSLIISIRDVKSVHLGDHVIYNDKVYFINNGTSAPLWSLYSSGFKIGETREFIKVHENKFKKVRSWKNLKNDLFYMHHWYMSSWYRIDLRHMKDKTTWKYIKTYIGDKI